MVLPTRPGNARTRCRTGTSDRQLYSASGEPRVLPLAELSLAPSQRRHSDSFPLREQRRHGGRRGAAVAPTAVRNWTPTAHESVSSRDLEHQQRGAQPRRDHRATGAHRHERRLPDPHLHDRHGRARALQPRHAAGDVGETCSSASRTTSRRRTRNAAQLEGKYYFAATPDDVGPAFAALQNQIIRLTK